MSKLKQPAQWLVVLLAMLLPFLIIRSFPKFFHTSDVDDLWRWSQAWSTDWRSVYINCERCNYPFVGTLLSAGVMDWIDIENFDHLANRFRYYLAGVDALNILIIWLILKMMQVKNAPFWAGLIGLLPSSWLGSSVWGQIDGLGQFLILSFFVLLIWFNASEKPRDVYYLFVILSALLLSLMVLTKQLIYFSVFGLGVILLANIIIYSRKLANIFFSILAVAAAFAIPIHLIDSTLILKAPYVSHLQYILATGSDHGDRISYTGFNLWVFFGSDPLASSRVAAPLQFGTKILFSVIPYFSGIFLFLLINSFLFFIFARYILKLYSHGKRVFTQDAILLSFVYLALVNLSFNLTLTGTHERYLYHFYPFILVACLGLMGRSTYFNRGMLVVSFSGAVVYGAFLYGYLTLLVRPSSQPVLQTMSVLHLLLFGYLIHAALRHFYIQTSDTVFQA